VIRSRPLVTIGLLVFAASMALNLSGFVFHAIVSRRLGVQQYGEFYALIAAYSIASLPAQFFSPVVTKFAAEFLVLRDEAHLRGLFRTVTAIFTALGVMYIGGALLGARSIAGFLHLAPAFVVLTGVMSAIGILSTVMRAFGQGMQQFGLYAGSLSTEAFAKVGAVVIATLLVLHVGAVVGAFLFGLLAGLIAMFFPLCRIMGHAPHDHVVLDWRRIMVTVAGAASLAFTSVVISFADVLIVKHYFSAQEAGLYSAASLGGKMLLYFLGFIPALLLSHAAHSHAKGESTRKALATALGVTVAVGIAGVAVYACFGRLILRALVGGGFDAALPLMIPYVVGMTFLAVANALASYGLATHRIFFALPLALATALTLAAMLLFHPSLTTVIDEMIGGTASMLAIVAISLLIQKKEGRASIGRSIAPRRAPKEGRESSP
jgi:O-antigen/teichoic acid export membrane protein